MSSSSLSLTKGSILKGSLAFTVPLIFGNLFQILYSAVDSFVVGNYVGSSALAAIGAGTQIINLMVGFIIGLTTGAGIIIAQYYGANDHTMLNEAVKTSFLFCTVGGLAASAAGFVFSPALLEAMSTPAEVIPEATTYLRIYFLGSLFTVLYNMGAGTLQALGDTRHPLYYLTAASVANIALDLLFVCVLGWGIAGAAFATVISQLISALCVIYHILHSQHSYGLCLSGVRASEKMLAKILKMGIPTGLQSAIVSFSNVIVQSYLNGFGVAAMAGSSIYGKVDQFVLLPATALSLTATTYIAQNIGARKYDRVRDGLRIFLIISGIYSVLASILMFFFASFPLSLFTGDQAAIAYGVMMARALAPGYILLIYCQIFIGTVRGAGDTFVTMVLSVLNLCGVRIIWLAIMLKFFNSIYTLYIAYPITWGLATLCIAVYYLKCVKPRFKAD